ncbi:lipopolysaccharide biosynthesis protein [Pedococcus cremeus]|uniref:lipopolysaccharide biosynthesis protein n=1 Tax=Pedococcus cremeus TaxID=587636 RepID=UPI00115FB001|nr:hypothetical protein [Pedococcus cremeus]
MNGYLASPSRSFRRARASILRINVVLMAVALCFGAFYIDAGRNEVGYLMMLVGVNIPLAGDAQLLYAAKVKQRRPREVMRAQWLAAAVRVGLAGCVAWQTGSAISLGVSVCAFSLIQIILLKAPAEPDSARGALATRERTKWAVQALSVNLPTQTDFLVASWLASPRILGIYFFSYQLTVGLSALIASPLSRVAIAELATMPHGRRGHVARGLVANVCSGVAVLSLAIGLLILPLAVWVPADWRAAVPVVVILLAGLPARFVAPIVDASLVAGQSWRRSIVFNMVDALGTGLAAVTALSGSPIALACATAAWKVLMAFVRVSGLEGPSFNAKLRTLAPATVAAVALVSIGVTQSPATFMLAVAGLAFCMVVAIKSVRPRIRHVAPTADPPAKDGFHVAAEKPATTKSSAGQRHH